MRHHPFIESLGKLEPDTPEWRSVLSGLLVLRLADGVLPAVRLDEDGDRVRRGQTGCGVDLVEDLDDPDVVDRLVLRAATGPERSGGLDRHPASTQRSSPSI